MSVFEAWIGKCHIQDTQGDDEHSFECFAAVWTQNRDGFEVAIQQHLKSASDTENLLWAEDVFSVTQWLQKHGHNTAVMGLAKTVHDRHLVELGMYTAMGGDGEPAPPPEYLTIIEHEIPPLPAQEGVPFWDKEWITPKLKELVFGQPKDTKERLRTYFIVDAGARKNVTGVFDLDTDFVDVPIQCLFKGEKAEELKEVAPYLIDMTLPDGAWDNKDAVPDFHKSFFAKHWRQNTGMFIRTPALFADVWGHFRRFPRIQVEEDKRWVYFRFWDPRIAPSYFYSIKTIPEKISAWVDMRGTTRIDSFVGNQTDSADAWTITPDWEKLEGFASIGMPMLSDVEMKGFEQYKLEKFDRDTAKELCAAYASMECDVAQFQKLSKIVRTWAYSFGINGERDITRLLHVSIALGAEFPKDVRFTEFASKLHNTNAPPNLRVKNCTSDAKTWLAMFWEGQSNATMHAKLVQCVGHSAKNYANKTALVQFTRELHAQYVDGTDSAILNAFLQECISVCDAHKISGNYAKICYVLCALLYGQNFTNDPLHRNLAQCFTDNQTDTGLQNALTALLDNFNEVAHGTR